jgi:hypothetical protein
MDRRISFPSRLNSKLFKPAIFEDHRQMAHDVTTALAFIHIGVFVVFWPAVAPSNNVFGAKIVTGSLQKKWTVYLSLTLSS